MLLFTFFIISTVSAQTIERSVISNGGFFFTGVNYHVDCTIGEPAITRYLLAQNHYLQGFNQPRICFGDLNYDGVINTGDVLLFFVAYTCEGACGPADLTNDNQVDTSDLLILLSLYGTTCY